MLSKKEKEIIGYFASNGVELSSRPFRTAARKLGMPEGAVIGTLNNLKRRGFIKNLRGVINHHKAGYSQNALIAWRLKAGSTEKYSSLVNDVAIKDERISHCYRRQPHEKFRYDIFTMMHAKTKNEIMNFARATAIELGLEHEVMFTQKELKKERLAIKELLCRD